MPLVIDLTDIAAGSADGFVIQGDSGFNQAGISVASAGDVNNDGFDDLIVGANGGDDGGSLAGEAYVVFGRAGGFGVGSRIDLTSFTAADGFIIQGDATEDFVGVSVASAGDVNKDGFADVIVGAFAGGDGGIGAGEAYVIFGKASGFGASVTSGGFARQVIDLTSLTATDGFIIQGDITGDQAGFSVASAGDVNNDGFDDLIVGANFGDDGGFDAGEACVIFGKAGGFGISVTSGEGIARQVIDLTSLAAVDGFIIQGDIIGDQAGRSVASAGDVNNDGFDDLIVGANVGDDGGSNVGEAYVIFGRAGGFGISVTSGEGFARQVIDLTGLTAVDGFIILGDPTFDGTGQSVASAGDVNNDGFADLIVGASFGDDGGTDAGEIYVIFGKAGGFGTSVTSGEGFARQVIDLTSFAAADGFIIQGDAAEDRAGFSVASAGDIDNDGFADLIVGAPGGDDGGSNAAGEAYVIFGRPTVAVVRTGTAAGETLRGGSQADTLTGLGGNDSLSGSDGSDSLDGGAGDDRLNGGDGADTLIGGIGNDTGDWLGNAGAVYVNLDTGLAFETALRTGTVLASTARTSTDTLTSLENARGSQFGDRFYGTAGDNSFAPGAGADIAYGFGGIDTLDYRGAAGAVFLDLATSTIFETALTIGTVLSTTARVSTDYAYGFENIIGTSHGDRLYGTTADNRIDPGAGNDIVYGQGGSDTIDYTTAIGAVYVDLANRYAVETSVVAGTVAGFTGQQSRDQLNGFANATGSTFGDRLYGTADANILDGGDGQDLIYGQAGNDILRGGTGLDRLVGGDGIDTLTGGTGDDRFFFVGTETGGPDTITDYEDGIDALWLNAANFGYAPGDAAIVVSGPDPVAVQPNSFLYDTDTGTLSYDADGIGIGAAVAIVTITGAPDISAADIVFYA